MSLIGQLVERNMAEERVSGSLRTCEQKLKAEEKKTGEKKDNLFNNYGDNYRKYNTYL